MNKTVVDDSELGTLLICSVRYAMGRMTYVVDDVCNLVQLYAGALSKKDRDVILHDVNEEIKRATREGRLLGMQSDHNRWCALLQFLGDI